MNKKTKTKVARKKPVLTRGQIDLIQTNNMLNTFSQQMKNGYSEEGWTLATRVYKNLSGFLHQREREILSGLFRDCFAASKIDENHIDSEIQKIKISL